MPESPTRPFTSMERALMTLLVRDFEGLEGSDARVGGDFAFDPASMDWYIRIDKVPGGRSDRFGGTFIIDLEVFSQSYATAESVSFALEALVLRYPHVVEVDGRKVVFDEVSQNVGVADLPWGADNVYRLGATYVITARRR